MTSSETPVATGNRLGRSVLLRLVAAIFPIVLLVVLVRSTGLLEIFEVEEVRAVVDRAGLFGVPLFVAVYGLGILAHVPGSVFVGGGVLAFGPGWGLAWCYLGALLGNLLSFGIVRLAGYRPLDRVSWPLADRIFARLVERPTGAVTAIRLVFPTTAPVNYALALTNVPFLAYLVGSLVGVLPQLVACVGLFAYAFESPPQ